MTEIPTSSSELPNTTNLDQIPGVLGYEETVQMKQCRELLVADYSLELLTEYQVLAEEYVDRIPEDSDEKRLGYIVSLAMIRRDVGKIEGYIQDLEDAINYANGMGFDDIVESLKQLLAQAKVTTTE